MNYWSAGKDSNKLLRSKNFFNYFGSFENDYEFEL